MVGWWPNEDQRVGCALQHLYYSWWFYHQFLEQGEQRCNCQRFYDVQYLHIACDILYCSFPWIGHQKYQELGFCCCGVSVLSSNEELIISCSERSQVLCGAYLQLIFRSNELHFSRTKFTSRDYNFNPTWNWRFEVSASRSYPVTAIYFRQVITITEVTCMVWGVKMLVFPRSTLTTAEKVQRYISCVQRTICVLLFSFSHECSFSFMISPIWMSFFFFLFTGPNVPIASYGWVQGLKWGKRNCLQPYQIKIRNQADLENYLRFFFSSH